MDSSILLAGGLIYATVFWALCWRLPAIALLLIFASAPFQNDVSGGGEAKFSIAEIHLILALPLFLAQRRRLSIGPIGWPVAAYFAIGIVSSILTWRGGAAITSFAQMFLFLVVVVMLFSSLAERPEQMRLALYGLIGVALFFAVVLLALRQQYVLGIHKNGIGGSMSVAFLVCLELWFNERTTWRKWVLAGSLALIAAGLMITLSRGSWLGAALGAGLIFAMRRQWALMARAGLMLLPVLWLAWSALPSEQRDYASSFGKDRRNIEARYTNIETARFYFNQSPGIGVGVGLRKQFDATNLAWTTLAETGVLGLVALASIHAAFFAMVWRTQGRLDRGDPLYSLVAIGGALILARLAHGMVDHYWARGPTMMAWAGAGMATGAYFALPERLRFALPTRRSPRVRALVTLGVIEAERRRSEESELAHHADRDAQRVEEPDSLPSLASPRA